MGSCGSASSIRAHLARAPGPLQQESDSSSVNRQGPTLERASILKVLCQKKQAFGHVIESRDATIPPLAHPPPRHRLLLPLPRRTLPHHLWHQDSRRSSKTLLWRSQAFLWSWWARRPSRASKHPRRGFQLEGRSAERRSERTSV